MIRSSKLLALLLVVAASLCAGACGGSTVSPSSSPTTEPESPAATGEPASPSPTEPQGSPAPTVQPQPTNAPEPGATMLVRAYFLLEETGGNPKLVPVLRTVPESKAIARAAMAALLAGPIARERGADPGISTMVPSGTRLLGVSTESGTATVNLSGAFATATSTSSARARLSQVVYTLTQFSTIDRVRFEVDGEAVTTFPPSIALDKPVSRATYRTTMLPEIFVDRPAWGAGLTDGGRVNGVANVFEAQFRMAVLDANGEVLIDEPVHATCGTGCWGTFDVTLSYTVSKGQWGTLRVWDPSEVDGQPTSVRVYPVWLTP